MRQDNSENRPGQHVAGPWARMAQPHPAVPDHLPSGWWLLPFAGLGLCLWTSLALALTWTV